MTRLLMVDHSSKPGGGQLGLQRYAGQDSHFERAYLFLEDGVVAQRVAEMSDAVTVSGIQGVDLRALLRHRRMLRKEIESLRPDVIVSNSLRSAVALAAANPQVPMLYYVRQDMSVSSMGRLQRAVALRVVFPKFVGFIANSEWTATTIPSKLRDGRTVGIAPPISGVSDIKSRTEPLLESGRPRIVWLGRLARWKGLHVLLDAMRLLEERGVALDVTVAGAAIHEGEDYESEIRERSSLLNSPPRFVGHVDDIESLLHASDILVHTSTIPEPFGQVIVQGMAAGLAVVASGVGGPAGILEQGVSGVLVPPSDAEALAATLANLLDDPERTRALGQSARRVVEERFTDDVMAQAFDEVVRSAARRV